MKTKALWLVAALVMTAGTASAQNAATPVKIGAIEISTAWARATPRGADVGAGYLKITNTGTAPDRLVSVSSDASGRVELHEMKMANGVMQMRPIANGLEIKPGETVELKPNAYHLMFEGLKSPFQQGQKLKATFTFEKAGTGEVEFSVLPIGSPGPASTGHGHMQMH